MTNPHALADVAALIGEPTRAAMLLTLLDGHARSATELARTADLSAPATSLHLGKMVQGGLLSVRKEGRHRFYRIASRDVVSALESLGAIATPPPGRGSLSPELSALRGARTCYDHFAGKLAVDLAERLEERAFLKPHDDVYVVTTHGRRWFEETMAIDVDALSARRRALARRCMDWTERRPHLAGALGAAVLAWMLERKWLATMNGTRALRVTSQGAEGLHRLAVSPF